MNKKNKSTRIDCMVNLPGAWLLLAGRYKPTALLASLKLHVEPAPYETHNQHMHHSEMLKQVQ